MNFSTPSGTYGWSDVFYSVVAKIHFEHRWKLGSILTGLGILPLPNVGTVGYFKQAERIYALVSPFVNMNKFDFHRYTLVSIVSTPKVFGSAVLVQARLSRKQALTWTAQRKSMRECSWSQQCGRNRSKRPRHRSQLCCRKFWGWHGPLELHAIGVRGNIFSQVDKSLNKEFPSRAEVWLRWLFLVRPISRELSSSQQIGS